MAQKYAIFGPILQSWINNTINQNELARGWIHFFNLLRDWRQQELILEALKSEVMKCICRGWCVILHEAVAVITIYSFATSIEVDSMASFCRFWQPGSAGNKVLCATFPSNWVGARVEFLWLKLLLKFLDHKRKKLQSCSNV